MVKLPVIVGFGGVNAAGRSSFHHAYRRLVADALEPGARQSMLDALAALMKLDDAAMSAEQREQFILQHTLIRRIETQLFDVEHINYNKRLPVNTVGDGVSFLTKARSVPEHIPDNWVVSAVDSKTVRVDISGDSEILLPSYRRAAVQAAGQLPTGFNPGSLYPSRNHPRGLQMAIYGASDAVQSMGIDWQRVRSLVPPDKISVYAGSSMGQLDQNGSGGMLGARYNDKRTTSKHCPFGFAEMPADFINAYVLGSVGNTGTSVGACASFLYNLRQGISDIQSGTARVVVVGNSEAPVVSDVMDGYAAMGALATDKELLALDSALGLTEANHRRAARPFSSNCGFTIAESSQFVVLFDDDLAVELGACVYGAVTDVFVNADGHKKSISAPGVGNYITVAKAVAAARALLGEESVQRRSLIQAHGTSTPQNRVSESHILNETAKAFGIEKWPVVAVKAFLGHSIGVSAGDQLMATLGVWDEGIIPGITTIDHIADDVFDSHLTISSDHKHVGRDGIDSAIINSKGFGGNNATATVVAPHVVSSILDKKHGAKAMREYAARHEVVRDSANDYDKRALSGGGLPIYKFDYNVLDGDKIDFAADKIRIPGYEHAIDLELDSPYAEFLTTDLQ